MSTCSDIPFCYVQAGSEETRINAIKKLTDLYVKYFEKYCHAPESIDPRVRISAIGHFPDLLSVRNKRASASEELRRWLVTGWRS